VPDDFHRGNGTSFASMCALLFLFIIAYASLEPFTGWSPPREGVLRSLLQTSTSWRGLWFDVPANLLAYIPLGFVFGIILPQKWFVLALCAALSVTMECAQTFLPMRHSSLFDTAVNTAGAGIGVVMAHSIGRSYAVSATIARLRRHLLPGRRGDFGLLLLLVFWFAHLSPGLSMFSSTVFLSADQSNNEPAIVLVQSVQTGLMFVGFALFADLLARTRLAGGLMIVVASLGAILSKSLVAIALLKPGVWGEWFSAPVLLGLVLGMTFLVALFWFPASTKRIVCNVLIIVAIALPLLIPDWLIAQAPARAFDWRYGHLLNFNTLSQTLLRLWPLLASIYLISTAGNHYQDRTLPKSS
jgi:VanZ family protein